MLNIKVEKDFGSVVNINPMSIKRDWMDVTPEKHAYRCFPVTQANMVGWYLSLSEDLIFTWNGIVDTTSDTVKIINGSNFSYTGRGQATVSINTGLTFKTDQDISLWTINPVNYFNEDFETMSSLISTSFYPNALPLAIKARSANKEILIKAGEPIATIIPISLTALDGTCIELINYEDPGNIRQEAARKYGEAAQKVNSTGQWTDWYREAVDENGNSVGSHETKTIRLSVQDNTRRL